MKKVIEMAREAGLTGEHLKTEARLTDLQVENSFIDVLGYAFEEIAEKLFEKLKEKK